MGAGTAGQPVDGGGGVSPVPVEGDDPRPLRGEPLALDLVNTRWMGPAGRQDLLTDLVGAAVWLRGAGLADSCPVDARVLEVLQTTRAALVATLTGGSVTALNQVLDRGRIRYRLVDGVPREDVELDEPAWLAGWLAAKNYVDLLRAGADRIRPCASSRCILYFYDTSKNGTRRWCSMAACGNRAKAARHYGRSREQPGAGA